jgi:hypothetical protein
MPNHGHTIGMDRDGGATAQKHSSVAAGSGRYPLQSRNPNTLGAQGSFSNNSSTEEYNSKEMKRFSTLESSNNECNKRLQTSATSSQGGINQSHSHHSTANSAHVRRSGSANDMREGSEPNLPQVPRPNLATRSNSMPSNTTLDEDSVIIEEKRRRVNGDGFTFHRYLRGRLLGKGGFAKVYLCTALDTNKAYAIKIVPKANLTKARARQKVSCDIVESKRCFCKCVSHIFRSSCPFIAAGRDQNSSNAKAQERLRVQAFLRRPTKLLHFVGAMPQPEHE